MLALKMNRLNEPLVLRERQFFKFVVIYRWVALLLTPLVSLILAAPSERGGAAILFAVACANNFLQTALYRGNSSGTDQSLTEARKKLPVAWWIGAEVFLCIWLNGLAGAWTSPYYLYSLAPIFQAAIFYGLKGAVLSSLTLTLSYLATLFLNVFQTGFGGHNWFLPVSYLTCFCLSAALFGYLTVITNQLRKYARTIEQNQAELSLQHLALQEANQRLEHLAAFGQVLQAGNSPARTEALALEFLVGLTHPGTTGYPEEQNRWSGRVRISRETFEDGVGGGTAGFPDLELNAQNKAAGIAALPGFGVSALSAFTEKNKSMGSGLEANVREIRLENRVYLAAPLVYQWEQYGTLVVDRQTGGPLNQPLLLALLADQLARSLGHLKQSQALAVEAERGRMAKDMHDVIAQALFGIGFNLDASLKLIDSKPAVARKLLEELRQLAFDTLTNVRAIIYDMWNEETGERHFVELVAGYIEKVNRIYPLKISLETRKLDPAVIEGLPDEAQKGLYRAIQEGLSNAAKHSGASDVRVRLENNAQGLLIQISDNGVGFTRRDDLHLSEAKSPGTVTTTKLPSTASSGLGLVAMRQRLEQFGASLEVETAPGQGTSLEVRVSLNG